MKDRIIKIADFLDSIDRESDADFLDNLVMDVSDPEDEMLDKIEIPEDEMKMLQEVFESLKRSLEA